MIDETTIKTEATRLREELKRERRQRDDTGRSDSTALEGDGGDLSIGDTEIRRSVQVLQRPGTASGRGTRTIRSNGRSAVRSDGRFQGQPEQSRSKRRGLDEHNPSFVTSSTADATEGTRRSIGNFERIDDVPRRDVSDETVIEPPYSPREKRKPGRPKKIELEAISDAKDAKATRPNQAEQQEYEHSKSVFQSVKDLIPGSKPRSVLNEAEVKNFYPILKGAIKDYGRYADQYLNSRLSTAGTIWGNLDADELDNLVSAMLSIGKRSGTVAEGVRLVAHSNDYVTTVMILVPRLMQTTQVLQQAPSRPKRTPRQKENRFRSRFNRRIGESTE